MHNSRTHGLIGGASFHGDELDHVTLAGQITELERPDRVGGGPAEAGRFQEIKNIPAEVVKAKAAGRVKRIPVVFGRE